MDLELGAKTSRVRSSLDSKVYANVNQVGIAITDTLSGVTTSRRNTLGASPVPRLDRARRK